MPLIHHLALENAWSEARRSGTYTVSTLGLDVSDVGFIHCSRPEQVDGVFGRYYGDVTEPVLLLTIDTDLLASPWQYDDVPGQALSFPHIYGPLNIDAVVKVEPFRPSAST
ncbi:DUF952 domain-containing protein [Aeromicrobium panaciterrae]|uniref:DUF952 domain-containing protein n=1 Tax=Aeromicrobium panaciterrae TaxID=363861 RepID=UPI0031DB8D36